MTTGRTSSLLNGTIPSMFNGVSQQPAALRLPTQCEIMDNGFPALVDGMKKRAPTEHIAKLNTDTLEDSKIHFINRDTTERYTVIVKNGSIEVYDLDGNAQIVNILSGAAYLTSTHPRKDFELVTNVDFTFILNRTIETAMDSTLSSGTNRGSVQSYSALPTSGLSVNDVYRVAGDISNDFDDYYVKWDGTVWEESTPIGIENTLDASTMPHQLVRNSSGEFDFGPVTWGERRTGDTNSAPNPSFIGSTITDIFFHKGRFGVLSNESIAMTTAPASDFTFFRESATVVIDSDPIDATADNANRLRWAVPFDKALMVMSDKLQFQLSGSPLTPFSASADQSTEFEASTICKPVGAGPNLYFPVPRGNHEGLREYFVDDEVVTNDAADITAHVPRYLNKDVFQLIATSNEDMITALNLTKRNIIYGYKYYWQGNEKTQSAWFRWILKDTDVVLGGYFLNTNLYLVIKRPDGTYLEKIDVSSGITETHLDFLVHLDRKVEITGAYDVENNWTTWILPYAEDGDISVIRNGSWTEAGLAITNTSRPTATTVRKTGDWSSHPCIVGLNYTLTFRFSEQFLKDSENNTIRDGRLMMRYINISYSDSSYFKVIVAPKGRPSSTKVFNGYILGISTLGAIPIESGDIDVPVGADSSEVTIDIVNDRYLPSIFLSAEWTALYHGKAVRR